MTPKNHRKKYKPKSPLETEEQRAFVTLLRRLNVVFFAVPNEAKRTRWEAQKMKAEGLEAGVPDLVICHAHGGYHALFIELKRQGATASSVTNNQLEWKVRLEGQGYKSEICNGASEAATLLMGYLKLPKTVGT